MEAPQLQSNGDGRLWWCAKTDSPPGRCRRLQQLPDRLNDALQFIIVPDDTALQLSELLHETGLADDQSPESDKRPDDKYVHLHGLRAVEHAGSHDRSVLGERQRRVLEIAAPLQDHKL